MVSLNDNKWITLFSIQIPNFLYLGLFIFVDTHPIPIVIYHLSLPVILDVEQIAGQPFLGRDSCQEVDENPPLHHIIRRDPDTVAVHEVLHVVKM